MPPTLPTISLPSGRMPALGLGTWMMGEHRRDREKEVAAIALGLDLGITLIDTAEMYADGGAEEVVGEAIAGRREQVFVVSKVYPHHASRRGAAAACRRSLKRLGTDHLDLYLLHWRGGIPLAQTVDAFESLRRDGWIREWGVSNFDRADMEELFGLPGGARCAANQVMYHLGCRGVEWDLLPFCRKHRVAVMAYSPVGRGSLLRDRRLRALAGELGASPAQIALAWLLDQPGVSAIPKAASDAHVRDNRAAADVRLPASALEQLERAFPAPSGRLRWQSCRSPGVPQCGTPVCLHGTLGPRWGRRLGAKRVAPSVDSKISDLGECRRATTIHGMDVAFDGSQASAPPTNATEDRAMDDYTHYDFLDLPPGASAARVETAYQTIKQRLNGHSDEQMIRMIHKAYTILSNAQQRQLYDAELQRVAAAADAELKNLLDGQASRPAKRVQDVPMNLFTAVSAWAA